MIDKLNPTTVHEPAGYSHVTISNVGPLAHLAGQRPLEGRSHRGTPGLAVRSGPRSYEEPGGLLECAHLPLRAFVVCAPW
jgi:hypothetical protein